jgi:protein SCO1/2
MSAPTDARPPAAAFQEAVSRLVARPLFWVVAVALMAVAPIASSLRLRPPPPLPVLATLPPFELVDQDGRRFGSQELEGRVWVASFIFTRCATICPAITARMARIQDRTRELATAFHLVSFSVDPGYDTPARLAEYARVHRASPRRWSFLTGPEEAVKRAVASGLKVSMGGGAGGDPAEIFHDSHLVLVDGRGRIRAYYDSDEAKAVDQVVRDAGLLVNRGG